MALVTPYTHALADWLDHLREAGLLRRPGSRAVYEHMWGALTAWAVGQGLALDALGADDLERYLAARAGDGELTPRYAWRLLRLVERVMAHRARRQLGPAANPGTVLLERREDLLYANAADRAPLPEHLDAGEAARLVAFLSALRPGRQRELAPWQEIRNRASVGLMLGAGLTPGEVRALQLEDVRRRGRGAGALPWKLRVRPDGLTPERETPIARWAARLLDHWLQVRIDEAIPGPMLFPSTRSSGKPWGKVAQYNAAREVLAAAGLGEGGGGSYKLRHTFAIRQLRRGHPPEDVARWLGVVDPSVMARYERVLPEPVELD